MQLGKMTSQSGAQRKAVVSVTPRRIGLPGRDVHLLLAMDSGRYANIQIYLYPTGCRISICLLDDGAGVCLSWGRHDGLVLGGASPTRVVKSKGKM